jgi:phosphoribosylformylglycinamidine synthase
MLKAIVTIHLKKSILDPQGSAVHRALKALGYQGVEEVRVGKHIEVFLSDTNKGEAEEKVKEMCAKLLANPVIEDYRIEIVEVGA